MCTKQLPLQQRIVNRIHGIFTSVIKEYKPKKQVYLKDFYNKNSDQSTSKLPSYIKKDMASLRKLTKQEIDNQVQEGRVLIILEDLVYDVTSWQGSHPGGTSILHEYKGTDATEQFFAFHRPRVANRLEQFLIGQVEQKKAIEKIDQQYKSMRKYLWENDYFTSDNDYYDKKYLVIILFFVFALLLALNQHYILSAISLGMFLKQSAYIAHDSLHYCILPQTPGKKFNLHGVFFCSVIFGISSDMWNEEHTMHHAITRRPMEDPQFNYLPIFLISTKELLCEKFKADKFANFLAKILVPIQHFSYVPLAMIVGRFNLYLISLISILKTGQFLNLIGMALYFTWYISFVSLIDGFWPKFIFVLLNHSIAGILHIQLLINHLAVEAFTAEEERNMDFFTFQLKTTRNVMSYWWNHWFHGGLQWQIEHHLFPQLPRHNLPLVTPAIKEICHENGVEYRENGFWKTLFICTDSMKQLASQILKGEMG